MIPGNANPLLLATAAAAAAAVEGPTKSLRFNSADSAYLSRTPSSAGNRKKWTWSGWLKRTGTGTTCLFSAQGSSNHTLLTFYGSTQKFAIIPQAGQAGATFQSNALHRDPSAFFHLVIALDTTQSTASNRLKAYRNGVEMTWSSSSYPSQNEEWNINIAGAHNIGRATQANSYLDGMLADVHFIDGSQLEPTSFGAFDNNGVWQAVAYSGTYGTNGFHLLDFENESTVGHDSSGNENDWTANNISTTAGSGNDVLFDSPTNGTQSDTGAGGEVSGNYATLNSITPVGRDCTFSNGNLEVAIDDGFGSTNNDGIRAISTIGMTSGKWYFEHEITGGSLARSNVGVVNDITTYGFGGNHWVGSGAGDYIVWSNNGKAYNDGNETSYGVSWTTGDIIGCAFDADNGNLYVYKNGTVMNSGTAAFTGLTSGPYYFVCAERLSNITANFGQRAFEHAAPSGYKALNTASLPTPTIADGSDYFDAKLYSGDGTGQTITGLGFSPDLVWIKQRNATRFHVLFDTVRGANKRIISNVSHPETTQTDHLSAFTSDGFTVQTSANTNTSSGSYVAWAWDAGSSTVSNTDGSITSSVRANASAGFSIVSFYSGSAGSKTIGHGLNAAPSLLLLKNRDTSSNWTVYHSSETSISQYLLLNSDAAVASASNIWGSAAPTSSVFGFYSGLNQNVDKNIIAYCFAPVAGYSAFGSYTGNGSTDGPFVYTGFRPAFLLIKRTDSSQDWVVFDAERFPTNPDSTYLWPNLSDAELTASPSVYGFDKLSNGWKLRGTTAYFNASGGTYIYAAFAENPFQANGGLAR
jgi:hypothetical protein